MSIIKITDNAAEDLNALLATIDHDRLFILTDENTHRQCLPRLKDAPFHAKSKEITIQAGDGHKSLDRLAAIWSFLSDEGATRHSVLINVGGGMITDIGGFAAATFKRGITTINIPTTLMASVDASIGGKTGINFNGLKNEIGAFHLPAAILIDSAFLHTLDRDNLLSGYAEMLKHALLDTEATYASTFSFDIYNPDYTLLTPLIARSIALKEEIVNEDPTEKGIRKALNLGHTIGHAIESHSFTTVRPLLHGHAVALGLVCELYLSHRLCSFPGDKLNNIAAYIKEYYPPFPLTCHDCDTLYQLMTHDKKNHGDAINFTLLSDVGSIRINQSADSHLIRQSLDFYRDFFGL